MMWLKSCPKCRGDLFEEPAVGGISVVARYVSCLQCGYLLSDQEEGRLSAAQPRRDTAPGVRVA